MKQKINKKTVFLAAGLLLAVVGMRSQTIGGKDMTQLLQYDGSGPSYTEKQEAVVLEGAGGATVIENGDGSVTVYCSEGTVYCGSEVAKYDGIIVITYTCCKSYALSEVQITGSGGGGSSGGTTTSNPWIPPGGYLGGFTGNWGDLFGGGGGSGGNGGSNNPNNPETHLYDKKEDLDDGTPKNDNFILDRNGGGGGTTDPGTIAPFAKAIFRNSNMNDENWKKIEDMLEKIVEDCLGQGLYSGLWHELKGGTLAIQFGDKNEFYAGTITLDMNDAQSNRFFHEMWHAYQAYQEIPSSFASSRLNLEMEAWYAQYLYLTRSSDYKEGTYWYWLYNDHPLGIAIQDIKEHVDKNGNFLTSELDLFNYLNLVVQPEFRNVRDKDGNQTYRAYPYDYSREGRYNFRNLKQLSTNCN